jgi:Mature-T-Cell Proliferation I type
MPKKVYDPCKIAACKIQSCLSRKSVTFLPVASFFQFQFNFFLENNWQESKCSEVLEAMRQCCLKWKGTSLCCEGIEIDDKKAKKQENR